MHHYFADKAELFAESISSPIRPDLIVREILAGPREQIGANLVRLLVTRLDEPTSRRGIMTLLGTALNQEFAATMLRQFFVREVLRRVAAAIEGDEPELRASLAASQIVGMIVVRYGIRIEPLASASLETVVARVGPVIQFHLTGVWPLDSEGRPRE